RWSLISVAITRLLLFDCSCDHRNLHSFPTRRSSDLGIEQGNQFVRNLAIQTKCHTSKPCDPTDLAPFGFTSDRLNFKTTGQDSRSEEHTSELQSRENLVCRLLLEKKKHANDTTPSRS